MTNRNELAEKLELIGGMFEIEGMNDLLKKFTPDTDEKGKPKPFSAIRFNAVVIQIESLLLKNNQAVADKIVAMNKGISEKDVESLDDADYANSLKTAIVTDVIGFFASSPSTDGRK